MRAAVIAIAGMHPGDVLQPVLWEKVAWPVSLTSPTWAGSPAEMWNEDIDLLVGRVGSAFGSDACAIIAVLLHELAHVSQGALEFVGVYSSPSSNLVCVYDLVRVGMAGSAFYVDGSDKKVERGGESEHHARARRSNFSLDIGKAAGGEEDADAFANLVAVERLAGFLRKDLEQMAGVWQRRAVQWIRRCVRHSQP